jgi:hypothetical protein
MFWSGSSNEEHRHGIPQRETGIRRLYAQPPDPGDIERWKIVI